jgi:hypothetical protein
VPPSRLKRKEDISTLLAKIKQPHSIQVRKDLEANKSGLLSRLMVRERPGKAAFRYWQEGPGFDGKQRQTAVAGERQFVNVFRLMEMSNLLAVWFRGFPAAEGA